MGMHWSAKCQRKQHYPNKAAAEAARKRTLARHWGANEVYRAYCCPFCGGWVVGRREESR